MKWGLIIKLEGLLCGNPTAKRGERFLAARQLISPPQGALIVSRKQGASRQEKK